jgi:hypothetical protein
MASLNGSVYFGIAYLTDTVGRAVGIDENRMFRAIQGMECIEFRDCQRFVERRTSECGAFGSL